MKKKKENIIIVPDFSFEQAMQHLANVKAIDVDKTMEEEVTDQPEDLPIENESDEPAQDC